MKILAQCGYGPSDKLTRGLNEKYINGVIFSPRYLKPEKLKEFVSELKGHNRTLLLDPEFFATGYLRQNTARLGMLEEWDCFQSHKRSGLISGAKIPRIIESCTKAQLGAGLDECIVPNVYVNVADSIDAGIAINFVLNAKKAACNAGAKAVFATLALDRDVFFSGDGFRDIIDAFTGIDDPPDGYYFIVGADEISNNTVRSGLYDPDVIAGLMYANYALSINGARVINGYCHLLSTLVGICGSEGAASGWHSGLRRFSMNKYSGDTTGGRTPVIRYVSTPLLSHITQTDFVSFSKVNSNIASGTAMDALYSKEEPSRTEEALQSWEALSKLSEKFVKGDVLTDLVDFKQHITTAMSYWYEIADAGLTRGVEANVERLNAITTGIDLFIKMVELA